MEQPSDDTLYSVLGVPESAGSGAIRAAYIAGIKRWHPDVNPASGAEAGRRTRRLIEAWETLKEPATRADYDRFVAARRARATAASRPAPSRDAAPQPDAPPPGHQAAADTSGASPDPPSAAASSQDDWRSTTAGRRAADNANRSAGLSMDDLLSTLWGGTSSFRSQIGFGTILRVGYAGWLAVLLICLHFTVVLTIPALLCALALKNAFFFDDEFVGCGTLLGGMLASAAVTGLGILLLYSILNGACGR